MRLMSNIHHTSDYKQTCHVVNIAKQCRLGMFQDSDFAGDLEDSKSTSGSVFVYFRKLHVCAIKLDVQETDFIIGLDFNYRKCCWGHNGNEEDAFLRTWISENCEEFREMQSVRHARYVGTND